MGKALRPMGPSTLMAVMFAAQSRLPLIHQRRGVWSFNEVLAKREEVVSDFVFRTQAVMGAADRGWFKASRNMATRARPVGDRAIFNRLLTGVVVRLASFGFIFDEPLIITPHARLPLGLLDHLEVWADAIEEGRSDRDDFKPPQIATERKSAWNIVRVMR